MTHYVNPVRLETDQKDLLISELKAENFELRNKERHYNDLYGTIINIERDCEGINEEKRVMEEQLRRRSDADGIAIRKLREQIEALALANRDFDIRIVSAKDEIAHLRAVTDSKAREIADLQNLINIRTDDNNILRKKTLDADGALRHTLKGIAITDDAIMARERDIDGLNKTIGCRLADIDAKTANIASAEAEMARLNDSLAKAKVDHDRLRCRLDDEVDINNRFRKENEDLLIAGANIGARIRDVEAQCASRDAQIIVVRDDIAKVKHLLDSSELCNRNLEEELDALNRHSDMLHQQNDLLNGELSDAIVGEDFVKRDKIAFVQRDNEDNIRNSVNFLSDVKVRSPVRSSVRTTISSPIRG